MLLFYLKDAVILQEQVLGRDIWMRGGWGWPQHLEPVLWRGLRPGALVTSALGWGWRGGGVWLVAPGRAVQLQVGQRWVFCEPAL